MQWTPREVLIPLVGDDGNHGALARVLADADQQPPNPARLDPAISELLEHGLYQAGQQAVAALRRCRQRRRGWLGPRSGALAVANPGDLLGLAAANAASAELGLALALALFRAQPRMRAVLATGTLAPGDPDPLVPVRPVYHLGAKLAQIERHFRQAGGAPPPRLCLVPVTDPDGTAVIERYAAAIAMLVELGITVQPVATLAEALDRAGARDLAPRPAERVLHWGLAGGTALVLLGVVATLWLGRPLPLDFASASLADGHIVLTPLRARWHPDTGLRPLPECRPGAGALPMYRNGEVVALRLKLPGDVSWVDAAVGHYAVVVGIGSESGVKVLPLSPDRSDVPLMPGVVQGVLIPVTGPEEDNLFAVLVRRGRPFDRAALQQQLGAHLEGLRPFERISAASNWVERHVPGVLAYRFRNSTQELPCP